LRHAQARNVIERIFGVLKRRFRILHLAPEYSIEIQSRIPSALVAIHNFIQTHNPHKETHLEDDGLDHTPGRFHADDNSLIPDGMGVADEQDGLDATKRRDDIAGNMWRQYQQVLQDRAEAGDETSNSDDDMDEGSDV
jgi:hypothetical protein